MKSPTKPTHKGEPASNEAALYPPNPDIDTHNDKIATMLELVQRNQELKERVRELEETLRELRKGIYLFPEVSLGVKNFVYRIVSAALKGE